MKALSLWFTNYSAIILYSSLLTATCDAVDLEERAASFVLGSQRIEIPGHPYAFNPSIAFWRGSLILSFRELPLQQESFPCEISSSSLSQIGIVFLNEDFTLDGEAQILELPFYQGEGAGYGRAEDARLINVDEHLFIAYSDNPDSVVTEGGFRMYIGELDYDGTCFFLKSLEMMKQFPGASPNRREKNWVPFDYQGELLFGYSIQPHRIFYPYLDGSETCGELASTYIDSFWKWGELRGGTPALRVGSEYLAFFHSSIEIATDHSEGITMPHYFIGAYTFETKPPFSITRMSPSPIIGKDFYHGEKYDYYWKPVQVVFPGGYVFDEESIYLAYGRQDHEIWITTIHRNQLLDSLDYTERDSKVDYSIPPMPRG